MHSRAVQLFILPSKYWKGSLSHYCHTQWFCHFKLKGSIIQSVGSSGISEWLVAFHSKAAGSNPSLGIVLIRGLYEMRWFPGLIPNGQGYIWLEMGPLINVCREAYGFNGRWHLNSTFPCLLGNQIFLGKVALSHRWGTLAKVWWVKKLALPML